MIRRPLDPATALSQMRDLCNRAEHCSGEIRKKLITKGINRGDVERIIERLQDERLIDDARFARLFARDKVEYAGWGKFKIQMALRVKQVSDTDIHEALNEIDNEVYIKRLRDLLRRKIGTVADAKTYEGRTKIFRFAVSRGFEPAVVSRLLAELLSSDCE